MRRARKPNDPLFQVDAGLPGEPRNLWLSKRTKRLRRRAHLLLLGRRLALELDKLLVTGNLFD